MSSEHEKFAVQVEHIRDFEFKVRFDRPGVPELTLNEKGRMRISGMQVQLHISGVDDQAPRMRRCLDLFEDYCLVTSSIRHGIPVSVEILDENGAARRSTQEHGTAL